MAGYTFVLVRGLARESRHWFDFPQMLQQQSFCEEVICCDLPGVGIFHQDKAVPTIQAMVQHLQQRYEPQFRDKPSVCLVGISLGGMVCYEYLKTNPKLVAQIVLINTSFAGLSPVRQRLTLSGFCRLVQIAMTPNTWDRERRILQLTGNLRGHQPEIIQQAAAIYDSQPVAFSAVMKQLAAAACYRFAIPSHPLPIGLVLCSRYDRLVDPRCSHDLAAFLDWQLKQHDAAGHDLPLDDPLWVLRQIESYLGSQGTQSTAPNPTQNPRQI